MVAGVITSGWTSDILPRCSCRCRFPRHCACEMLERYSFRTRDSSQKKGIKKKKARESRCLAIHGFDDDDDEEGIKVSFRGTFVTERLMKILNDFSRISAADSRKFPL